MSQHSALALNLVIDIGNTKTKIACFQKQEMVDFFSFFNEDENAIIKQLEQLNYQHSILSSTAKENPTIIDILQKQSNCIELSAEIPLPITIGYTTKETLGDDRISAVCGAKMLQPNQNCLVVTAGTCITYNLITNKNVFLGGAISPGIYMRYRAMHEFTGKLPLVENKPFDELIGQSTEQSLQSGVRNGILAEVDGIIAQYQLLYKNLQVFICGGDTSFFVDRLKSKIFANQHLVLYGMNNILLYNI